MNYEQQGDIAILNFDDGRANVVGYDLVTAMHQGLERAQQEASAVVVVGARESEDLVSAGGKMLLRMFSHPQPLVAAGTGHAIAAGAFMLLSCDTRIGQSLGTASA